MPATPLGVHVASRGTSSAVAKLFPSTVRRSPCHVVFAICTDCSGGCPHVSCLAGVLPRVHVRCGSCMGCDDGGRSTVMHE